LFWFNDVRSEAIAMNQNNERSEKVIAKRYAESPLHAIDPNTPSPPEEEQKAEFRANKADRVLKCSQEFQSKDLVCLFIQCDYVRLSVSLALQQAKHPLSGRRGRD
jgi:hypothetical protein